MMSSLHSTSAEDVGTWASVRLEDVAHEITVGHVGPMAHQYISHGVPFLRSQDIVPFRVETSNLRYISSDFHARLKRSVLRPGDVVVARTGERGVAAVIPETLPVANCSDLVIIRPSSQLDSRFLAYYITGAAQHHVAAHLVGAVQQHLNVASARQLVLPLPSLSEQRGIASILGALDDKIELNRQMNETLEATARAIFTSWFVDVTHTVNEDHMPATWRRGILSDMADIVMGKSPPGESYNESADGVPFYQGVRDFGFRYPSERVYCTSPTRWAEEGDVLLSVRAPVGTVNVAPRRCAIGRGLAAVRSRRGTNSFVYYLLQASADLWDGFNAAGSVFGFISTKDLRDFAVTLPPPHVEAQYNRRVAPIDALIAANTRESETLSRLRDALLPKLLSGELRVRGAEQAVEMAI